MEDTGKQRKAEQKVKDAIEYLRGTKKGYCLDLKVTRRLKGIEPPWMSETTYTRARRSLALLVECGLVVEKEAARILARIEKRHTGE